MNYFKTLGIIFGLMAFLKPVYLHLIPWDENRFISKTYSEKRPSWIVAVALVGLVLVAFTWYMELTTDIRYSLVITLLFSLSAIKAIMFIFDYTRFQNWVAVMINRDKGREIIMIDMLVSLLGLILIIASIFLL